MSDSKKLLTSVGERLTEKRRSQRVQIPMPVIVRGKKLSHSFEEVAQTATVSAHGCMLRLDTQLELGERVSIISAATSEEQPCTVTSLGQSDEGKTEVGIEFTNPCPSFWHIAFPPEDWDPADRKRFNGVPPAAGLRRR